VEEGDDMSDSLKWTLRVRVEGLSLWMNRTTHVDVLFPDDGFDRAHGEHHFVTVEGDVDGSVGVLNDLHGTTLDLRTTPSLVPQRSPAPAVGMLPLTVEPGSIAAHPDAVLAGTHMVAGLRLPIGQFVSLGSELGPFTFAGDETLFLGYGATWMVSMFGPRDLQIGVHPFGEATSLQRIGSTPPPTGDISLLVQCLSRRDRQRLAKIAYGDALPEVACLGKLTRRDQQPLSEVPQYFGPSVPAPTVLKASPAVTLPDRPCPLGYGAPFA
jgi:hypothetical protein